MKLSFSKSKGGVAFIVAILFLVIATAFWVLFYYSTPQSKSITSHVHRVLMIHSFDKNNPIYPPLNNAIKKEFERRGVKVVLRTFYLNSELYWPHENNARMRKFLKDNITWNPDLIMINDDQALVTFINCRNKKVAKIPVIFAGVNYLPIKMLEKQKNIAGFHDEPDCGENIAFIEKMIGKVAVNINFDQTNDFGARTCRALYKQFKGLPYRVDYSSLYKSGLILTAEDSVNMPNDTAFVNRLTDMREQRPDSTYIRFVNFRRGVSGEALWYFSNMRPFVTYLNTSYTFASNKICQLFDRPVFTAIHEGFGQGLNILGGYMTTAEQQAKEQVEAADLLFQGTAIDRLGIQKSKKVYLLDWKTIYRWNWKPLVKIPSYVKIINMPFYVKYQTELTLGGSAFLIILFSLLIYLSVISIRERRKKELAEKNLMMEKMYLSLALRNGNIFVWRIEDSPNVIFGREFYDYLSLPCDDITLSQGIAIDNLCEKIYPDDRELFLRDTHFVLSREGKGRVTQCRINFNGKGYQWWEFRSGEVFLNHQNKSYIIIGLCLNIQEFKDQERVLIEARQKAEEADRMKSAFVANMSHDIRTPLNAIVGFSNLLVEDPNIDAEEKSMCINTINMNTQHLLKLINDILDLSRIEAGSMKYSLKECNMHDLLQEVYNTHKLLMPEGVDLKLSLPEKDMTIVTDYHRIVEVLTNLISNSIKFTEHGVILMGYNEDSDGQGVSIYVKDSGKGIPLDKQKKVFDRFTKVDEYTQGAGLGLVICKHIVDSLGGSINLESEGEGKGTCFTIHLPSKSPKYN